LVLTSKICFAAFAIAWRWPASLRLTTTLATISMCLSSNDTLHVVARNRLVAFAQKPCVGIGLRQLPLVTCLQFPEVGEQRARAMAEAAGIMAARLAVNHSMRKL